jgi:hypothetical protein
VVLAAFALGCGGLLSDASSEGDAHPLVPACSEQHCALAFASGPEWASYSGVPSSSGVLSDALGQNLGPAADVCLNEMLPANCPSDALLYAYVGSGHVWLGGASIPGAYWIWRADVTPGARAPLQVAVFEKTFTLGAHPTGTIQISADDSAQVFVNHTAVGSIGSIFYVTTASRAQNLLTAMDLTPALRAGENTIAVVAQNGPYACASVDCSYTQNPAGVVFAGTLRW